MKKVLVLGAGLVSRPLVAYLLDHGYQVMVASRTVSKAKALVGKNKNGRAVAWTFDEKSFPDKDIQGLVKEADLVVSLLPPANHPFIARLCLRSNKHLVTTSYVGDPMRALDREARRKGLVFLNEAGLDPGIDHMSAMRVIHGVERRGGKVLSFRSTTGALPAHEANTNPFGYKFSWAPRGVLLASRNAAKWLQDGKVVSIPGEELFENYAIEDVPGAGSFENYPNRNSVPYREIYGLKDAKTVYRGTFRMTGWCETLRAIVALGWLQDRPLKGFKGRTYADLTAFLVKARPKDCLPCKTADFLGLPHYSAVVKRLEWLGLFSDKPLPKDRDNPLDYLNVISLQRMAIGKRDRDLIVMHHEFVAEYKNRRRELLTSTFVDHGEVGGDTAIARTVSIPAAIAVRMILEGKLRKPGVLIPVDPEIYNPILDELEDYGIRFVERKKKL
jgi:saccharopine dehydrogenase (NADP+, L-glutamate forming)